MHNKGQTGKFVDFTKNNRALLRRNWINFDDWVEQFVYNFVLLCLNLYKKKASNFIKMRLRDLILLQKKMRFLLWIFICICFSDLQAVSFSFRHYKVEQGLASNNVNSIIQDRYGFVWIGTDGGLVRFDGIKFKNFLTPEYASKLMFGGVITHLLEHSSGEIWVAADNGVYIFDPLYESMRKFEGEADGVGISTHVNNMVEDQLGNVWIATRGQGIFRYHPSTNELVQYRVIFDGRTSSDFDIINHIYVDKTNQIWAAPRSQDIPLITFDASENCFVVCHIKKSHEISIYSIFEDSRHELWLGTWDKGICRFNRQDNSLNIYLAADRPGGILHVHDICEYEPGMLLIGSDDGLSLFNTQTGDHQLFVSNEIDPTSLSDKFIYPIMKDREGGIWVGTYFGGVNYLSPNSSFFERYSHSQYQNSVNGNVIAGFTEDVHGNIWIASDDGGLNMLNIKTGLFKSYMPEKGKNSLSYHNVHALCWDDDDLWIGTYSGGLNILHTKTGLFSHHNHVSDDETTLDRSIYAIFKDKNKQMWVGTMSGINVYERSKRQFKRVMQTNITTISIVQDKKDWIWFATLGKGVYRLNPHTNQWRHYTVSDSLAGGALLSNTVNSMLCDSKGQLWLATTNGLCQFDYKNEGFIPFVLNDVNVNVQCIIEDDEGSFWLTTTKGLIHVDNAMHKNYFFTKSDGLVSEQFIVNSGFKSSRGKIYIGTANGFNAFDPKDFEVNIFKPDVVVTDIEVFNKPLPVSKDKKGKGFLKQSPVFAQRVDLSHLQNVFTINFAALSYTSPEKINYAYMLEGFDKEWNDVGGTNRATYTNLPPGDYMFKVKSSDSDGIWNEDRITSLAVVIHPPFWLSKGFKVFYLILFVAILVLVIRYSLKRTEKKQKERIRQIEQEKEKELYDAKISFFTMIAHEIRTPVSLIMGPIEKIIYAADQLPDLVARDFHIIERNSKRLLQLVNQLLDFRKADQGVMKMQFSTHNIFNLLCNVADSFKPAMEQRLINFTLHCPDKKFEAEVDQDALIKILSNLFTNAIKFTKGQIHLSCGLDREKDFFTISISNNGPGISPADQEKIFQPFYQVQSTKKEGTGLGLSLVKSLVEAHSGSIEVADAYPSGVVFTVKLPVRQQQVVSIGNDGVLVKDAGFVFVDNEDKVQAVSDQVTEVEQDAEVVLIVEDSPEMLDFLRDSFADNFIVLTASDGLEALKILQTSEVNIIVSDLMMPNMDGLELCNEVKTSMLWSHIPFVLLTAKTDVDSKMDGMNVGADSYIEKPFSMSYLQAKVKNLIDSREMLRKKYSELPFVPIKTIAGNPADEAFLSKTHEILEQNIANEDFNIDQLVQELGISRSGLFAKIKSLTGLTPNELLQLIRLKKAATYLLKKEYRINEVAYMVGFSNPSYFSKCFQKQFGLKPMEFIQQNLHQEEV